MNGLNIILVLIIIYIIYQFTASRLSNKHIKREDDEYKEEFMLGSHNNTPEQIAEDIMKMDNVIHSYDNTIKKDKLNPNFLNIQFHNDYRDVMTALNNIMPDKKQFFNLANQPIIFSKPETDEIKNIVKDFVEVLNDNIKNDVPSFRNPNSGWDEAITDPTVQSGWEKVRRSLGLAPSLYDEPATKQPVKLIKITSVMKYETEDEIRYICDIILQKKHVDDQMILRCSFVQDKRPLKDENNFFVTKTVAMRVVIEELSILGFLSKEGTDGRLLYDQDKELYYNVNLMENNNLTDPRDIMRVLDENYKQRNREMNQLTAMLDEEGQNFHRTLPKLYEFDNIRGTRTVYDDLSNKKRVFY